MQKNRGDSGLETFGQKRQCSPVPRGIVISDLHLFSVRSDGERRLASLHESLIATDVIVLNGDTFDFRWSRYRNEEETVAISLDWLRRFISAYPDAALHFICGNHDCLAAFTQHLDGLEGERPSFRWHETHLRIGRHLFIHGDCAHRCMDAAGFGRYRMAWENDRQRHRWLGHGYRAVDRMGITGLAHRMHFRPRRTLERLVWYLDRAVPDWKASTSDCYFGHTHLPFQCRIHEGVRFHNTGCAIAGGRFQPGWFEFPDS